MVKKTACTLKLFSKLIANNTMVMTTSKINQLYKRQSMNTYQDLKIVSTAALQCWSGLSISKDSNLKHNNMKNMTKK